MWKKRLGTIKSILSTLAVALAVLIPLYGFLRNALNEFSRGLLFGALLVAFVAVVVISVFDFWVVNITEAEEIAFDFLRKRDARWSTTMLRDNTELKAKENEWHIFDRYERGDDTVTYEVVVDARTGRIRKSKFDKASDHRPVRVKGIG